MERRTATAIALCYDTFQATLLGIWLWGGVPWKGHLYLSHGADSRRAAVLLGVFGYFLFPFLRSKSLFLRAILALGGLLNEAGPRRLTFLIFLSLGIVLSVYQTLALRFTLFDVGIFHQILWSLTHGLGFHSTLSGAGNFLRDHFSPGLVLLVPFFWIFGESPFFLPVLQNFLLLGGAAAWVYLASRMEGLDRKLQGRLAAATLVFVLSFDSLWKNIYWGFHENCLAFFCLSWAFAFLFSGNHLKKGFLNDQRVRKIFAFILLMIAGSSKETLLLEVAFLLGCWAISEVSRKKSLMAASLILVAGVLVSIFIKFEQIPHPQDKNYFLRYYSYLGNDLKSFSKNILVSPQIIIQTVGAKELLKYLWTIFSPWLFLPFLCLRKNSDKKLFSWIWGLAIIPSLMSAALATYYALRRSEYHYVLELWPILAVFTLFALARIKSSLLIWSWAIFGLIRMDYDPIGELREFWKESRQVAQVRKAMMRVPQEASVIADGLAGPWVAGRKWVTQWPRVELLPKHCPDFIWVRNVESEKFTSEMKSLVMDSSQTKCSYIRIFQDQGWTESLIKGFKADTD